LLLELNEEKSQVNLTITIVGLMILLGVLAFAVAVIAVMAISALVRRRDAGQLSPFHVITLYNLHAMHGYEFPGIRIPV